MKFEWIVCFRCKEDFGMCEETYRTLKKSSASFYCPFGHQQHFVAGPTEADKLRLERDRLKQQAAQLQDSINYQRERAEVAERRAAAARGQITRLKNRAVAGVCPCCNRSFENLKRHMATKHKGFLAEEVQSEVGKPLH